MYIANIVLLLCFSSLLIAGVTFIYHIVLAFVALLHKEMPSSICCANKHTFGIIIPAHNEHLILNIALNSCKMLDYPREKFSIYVIADNCTDDTAEIARKCGAICYERHDPQQRGKGHALEWVIPKIVNSGLDAFIVLDADCTIDSNALQVFDRNLESGHQVLQCNDLVGNPDDSAISYVLALGGYVANKLFHAPKSLLGLPVLLVGSGMVFHRDILLRFPWKANSLCEDTEYSLNLQKHNVPARFISEVKVLSDFPINRSQFIIQRRRWIRGGMHAAWCHGVKLLFKGLINYNYQQIDAGFTSIILSRPLVLGQLLLTFVLVGLYACIAQSLFSSGMFFALIVILLGYLFYAALGMYLFGLTWRRIKLLFLSPLVVMDYMLVAITTMLRPSAGTWDKTPRLERSNND